MRGDSARPNQRHARIFASQFGVITTCQAIDAGISKRTVLRRAAGKDWERVLPGIYRTQAVPRCWQQDLQAALLFAGKTAVASHLTAAVLWGLIERAGTAIELTVDRKLRISSHSLVRIVAHRQKLEASEITRIGSFPVTTVPRTILDIAARLSIEELEAVIDTALLKGLTTVPKLAKELENNGGRGRQGSTNLRAALNPLLDGQGARESELERKFLRFAKRYKIPAPTRQYRVKLRNATYRIDFAYPEKKVAIETDSYRYHGGRREWRKDLARRNTLMELGWTVAHATLEDIEQEPDETAERIRRALKSS